MAQTGSCRDCRQPTLVASLQAYDGRCSACQAYASEVELNHLHRQARRAYEVRESIRFQQRARRRAGNRATT